MYNNTNLSRADIIPRGRKNCNLGAFIIRLSSNFAGWWNSVIQKSYVFCFLDFNGFWGGNDVTTLTAKLKFQDMAKIWHYEKAMMKKY